MSLTALETARVWEWLDKHEPGAPQCALKRVVEREFGKLKCTMQMGYGEGSISYYCKKQKARGTSSGLCTTEEALLYLVSTILRRR